MPYKAVLIGISLTFAFAANATAALTYTVSDQEKLIAISGLEANSFIYKVEFIEGTCADAYGDCTNGAMPFDNSNSAYQAAQALLAALNDNISVGGTIYNFDSSITQINGCGVSTPPTQICLIYTPFGVIPRPFSSDIVFSSAETQIVNGEQYVEGSTGHSDSAYWTTYGPNINLNTTSLSTYIIDGVYARWTEIATPVPEPSVYLMFFAGLSILGAIRRR